MALCPFAKQLPLGWPAPPIHPTAVCLHSAVTPPGYDLFAQWQSNGVNGVACHFYVRGDGTIEQYLDTSTKANAQYAGNDHCISVESEGMNPDTTPWNPAELAAIEKLLQWCNTTHGIPLAPTASSTSPGVAYHAEYGEWNLDAHSCPGAARIAQIPSLLHPPPPPPSPQETDMPLASITNPNGEAEVFWTDSQGEVFHSWQTVPGAGPWSPARQITGVSGVTGLTAVIDGKNVPNLVAVTGFGLLHTWKKSDGTWAPWVKFPS